MDIVRLGKSEGAIVDSKLGSFDGDVLGLAIGIALGVVDGNEDCSINGA